MIENFYQCATLIGDSASATLPFTAYLGARVWPMIESFDASLYRREPPDFATERRRWVALAILHRALYWHIASLPSAEDADRQAAVAFAEEVVRVAHDDRLRYRIVVPLDGIDIAGGEEAVLTEGAISLSRLSDVDQGKWFEKLTTVHRPGWTHLAAPRVTLEISYSGPRDGNAGISPTLVGPLIAAMQLHGYSLAGVAAAQYSDPEWVGGDSLTPLLLPAHSSAVRALTRDDLRAVVATAERLGDHSIAHPRSPRDVALRRYTTGAARGDPADAVLDFAIALEVLLLPDDPEAGQGNLSYRFRVHGAHYLADSAAERRDVFRRLRDIYNTRSGLVHGGHYPSPAEIAAARDSARDLAARGLLRAVSEGFPSAADFNEMLLGSAPPFTGSPAGEQSQPS